MMEEQPSIELEACVIEVWSEVRAGGYGRISAIHGSGGFTSTHFAFCLFSEPNERFYEHDIK
jgi:hypothetical protein